MKSFDHPNVLKLIGVCVDAGPAPYIVMPIMANGSLLSYLKKERSKLVLPEDEDDDLVSRCICDLPQANSVQSAGTASASLNPHISRALWAFILSTSMEIRVVYHQMGNELLSMSWHNITMIEH